jgi:hypothetical protein
MIVSVLCFLMVVAVVPAVVLLSAPRTEAVAVGNWNDFANNLANGNSVELTASFASGGTATVKAGATVTIDMNGYRITHDTANYSDWGGHRPYFFENVLKMNLNINAGNILEIPANTFVTLTGGGELYVRAVSKTNVRNTERVVRTQAILNRGSLTIDGTNVTAIAAVGHNGNINWGWPSNNGSIWAIAIAVGIYNDGGSVSLMSGTVNTDAFAFPGAKDAADIHGVACAVGVYSPSGSVSMSGGSIWSRSNLDPDNINNPSRTGSSTISYAAGIHLSDKGTALISGGTLHAESELWHDTPHLSGMNIATALGVQTANDNAVTITGSASIDTDIMDHGQNGTSVANNFSVGDETVMDGNNGIIEPASPQLILDEYGTSHDGGADIKNGGAVGAKKVLSYYRFYSGSSSATSVEQVNFAAPNVWMQDRIGGGINLNGTNGAYLSGDLSCDASGLSYKNTFFYDRYDMSYHSYSLTGDAPSIDHNSYGTAMTTLPNGNVSTDTVTIVYFNFYKKDAVQLTSCEATDTEFTYLGRSVIPGTDFGFKLFSGPVGSGRVDETAKFNISGSDSGKFPVSYSHTRLGENNYAAGLPSNVGAYTIKVIVANETAYSSSARNFGPYEGTFDIIIKKIMPQVQMNTLTLTYGNTLNSLGSTRVGDAGAIGDAIIPSSGERVPGVFVWNVNASTGYTKDVSAAGYLHTLTFVPDSAANVDNAVVDVYVKVAKRALTITANAVTSNTYGDVVSATYAANHGMNVTVTGAAPHDNPSSWIADIEYVMDMNADGVFGDDSYYMFADPENPDAGRKEWWHRFETPAGTYQYKASGDINEHVNRNYEITCTDANFVVAKRQLTAVAQPAGRSYEPGNTSVAVNFEIISGKPEGANHIDAQLVLESVPGQISGDAAGTYTVAISRQPVAKTIRSGELVENASYQVTVTNFGSSTVVIGKAQPVLVAPVFQTSMVYDTARTLGTLEAQMVNDASNIPGVWRWVYDATVTSATIPQVGNQGFYAKFYPDASVSGNYTEGQNTLIAVPITKKTVTVASVAYNASNQVISDWTLTYGDAKPRTEIVYTGFAAGENQNTVINTANGSTIAASFGVDTNYAQYSPAGSTDYTVAVTGTPQARNYEFNVARSTPLIVLKKQLTVAPLITWTQLTYGDPRPDITILNYSFAGLARESDRQEIQTAGAYCFTNYEAGSNVADNFYYVKVDGGITATNYEMVYPKVYFNVKPKTLTVTANPITIEYGDALPQMHEEDFTINPADFVLGHHLNPDAVISGIPSISCPAYSQWSPVGQYAIEIAQGTLASVNGNYVFNCVNTNVYLTVKKASVSILSNPVVSVANTKTLAEASIVPGEVWANVQSGGNNIPGTWVFVDPATVPAFYGQLQNTYEIYFAPRQDYQNRYDNSQIIRIYVEVLPTPMSGEVGIYGSPMVGETLHVVTDGLIPNEIYEYTCQWYVTDGSNARTAISGATGYSFAIADAAYEGKRIDVVVTLRPGAPYTGSRTSALTEPISPNKEVPQAGNFALVANGGEYNGNAFSAAYTTAGLAGELGAVTVKYNNSSDLPVKAGRYRVTLDISSSAAYGPVVGLYLGDLVIAPRPLIVYVGVESKNYDSTTGATLTSQNTLANLLAQDESDVELISSTIRAVFVSPDASTNAQLTVSGGILTGDASRNYALSVRQQQAPVEIRKAGITAVARVLDRDYIPGDYTVGVEFSSFTGVFYSDTGVHPQSGTGSIADNTVGNRRVSVSENAFTIDGEKAGNYYLIISNKDALYANIALATPQVTVPIFDSVEYEALTLAEQFTIGEHWRWSNPNELVQVSQTQYTLIYDLENPNYKTLTIPVSIHVEPAELTITVQDKAVTYGDLRPASFDAVYSGFKGSDTRESAVSGTVGFLVNYDRGSDAGTYAISQNDTLYAENYDIRLIPGTLHVQKKDIYTTFTVVNRIYTPGSTTVQLVASDLSGKAFPYDAVYISNARPLGYIASPNAGQNIEIVSRDAISLTGSKSHNYNLVITNDNDLKVNIDKANPSGYRFPGFATIDYSKPLAEANFQNYAGDGTFIFTNAQYVPTSLGIFDYEVRFVPTDSANYNEVTSLVPIQVSAAQVTSQMQVEIVGVLTVGETLNAVISGLNAEARGQMQVRWVRLDEQGSDMGIIVSEDTSYVLTQADIGKYLKVEVSLNGNYVGYKQASAENPVSQIMLSFWQKLISWINSILLAFQSIGR